MFELTIQPLPMATVLKLAGDLDTNASQELDASLDGLITTLVGDLTIDLSELTYLNSTGIRSFIRLHKLLKEADKSFVLTGVSAKIFRIFRYCGLDTFFTFEHVVEVVPTRQVVAERS
jgi:anti-sigma B factor antagonist